MKRITLDDFLTHDEILKALKLWRRMKGTGRFASAVAEDIISPNLPRINAALGQENDPKYLAYVVEYVLNSTPARFRGWSDEIARQRPFPEGPKG